MKVVPTRDEGPKIRRGPACRAGRGSCARQTTGPFFRKCSPRRDFRPCPTRLARSNVWAIIEDVASNEVGFEALTIALRTRHGNVIESAPMRVAFEIDGIESGLREGWSVLVQGTMHRVDTEAANFAQRFDSEKKEVLNRVAVREVALDFVPTRRAPVALARASPHPCPAPTQCRRNAFSSSTATNTVIESNPTTVNCQRSRDSVWNASWS